MLGYGSRAGVVSTAVLASGAVLGLSVLAARSPWSPFLMERLGNFGRPVFHARDYVPLFPSQVNAAGDPDIDAATLAPEKLTPLTPQEAEAANALLPYTRGPLGAPAVFALSDGAPVDMTRARACLTAAVYYEARSEGVDGERAVAQVVLNRVRHRLYPKSVCGVVYQGADRVTGCQFTFACDGSLRRRPDPRGWALAQAIADESLHGRVFAPVGLATHYHTRWVLPYWAPTLSKLTRIGAHIFYRFSGGAGAPGSYAGRYVGGEVAPDAGDLPAAAAIGAVVVPVAAVAFPAVENPGSVLAPLEVAPRAELTSLIRPEIEVALQAASAPPPVVVAPDPVRPRGGEHRVNRLAVPSGW